MMNSVTDWLIGGGGAVFLLTMIAWFWPRKKRDPMQLEGGRAPRRQKPITNISPEVEGVVNLMRRVPDSWEKDYEYVGELSCVYFWRYFHNPKNYSITVIRNGAYIQSVGGKVYVNKHERKALKAAMKELETITQMTQRANAHQCLTDQVHTASKTHNI